MVSILEQQVTELLTSELGRAPTAAEIANGMISPWTLAQIHNTLNAVQSIFAVNPGDDLQTAVNKLASNGGGVLFLNPGTYYLTNNLVIPSNIRIQGVGSEGSIIDFGNGAFQIQMIGTLGNEIISPFLQGITVQNSSIECVKADYVINLGSNDLTCRNGTVGLKVTNTVTANINSSLMDDCGIGLQGVDSELFTLVSSNVTNSTSGGGFVFTNCSNSASIACSADQNIGGGFLFTSCSNFGLENFAITNTTGNGLEFDGGGNGFAVALGFIDTSSGDGIKLHNSASNVIFSGSNQISNSGGWGVNIADVGCSNILGVGNVLANNFSGNLQDLGTNTIFPATVNQFL